MENKTAVISDGGVIDTKSDYRHEHLTAPKCAATVDTGEIRYQCTAIPKIPCKWCKLVSYCSAECIENDRVKHETECAARPPSRKQPKQITELSTFENLELHWSRCPARDVLNLQNNEGLDFNGSLNLFFFGGSGLRHLIYSMVKLPSKPACGIRAMFNDGLMNNTARTLFSIFLLTALEEDPFVNAEALVHLWYSLKLPKPALQHIRRVTKPMLTKAKISVDAQARKVPKHSVIPVVFSRSGTEFTVELTFAGWVDMFNFLDSPTYVHYEADRNIELRTIPEMSEQTRSNYSPGREACARRWAEDGLMLPYNHPRSHHNKPNPVFSCQTARYPHGASAEPFVEWPREELLEYNHPLAHQGSVLPPNDMLGKMFYYVRDHCVLCQYRLRTVPIQLVLMSRGMSALPEYCNDNRILFDRVEVGELFDQAQFVLMTTACGMLRESAVNPYARLIAVTRLTISLDYFGGEFTYQNSLESHRALIKKLAPVVEIDDLRLTAARRHLFLMSNLRDWDKESEYYFAAPLGDPDLDQPYGPDVLYELLYGIKLESKNIIVPRWDDRPINGDPDSSLTLQNFNRMMGWPDRSARRWLEWSKTRTMTFREWAYWVSAGMEYQAAYNSGDDKLVEEYEASLKAMVASRFRRIVPDIPQGEQKTALRSITTGKIGSGVLKTRAPKQ